jgi:hypothetical protein
MSMSAHVSFHIIYMQQTMILYIFFVRTNNNMKSLDNTFLN